MNEVWQIITSDGTGHVIAAAMSVGLGIMYSLFGQRKR